MINGKLTNLTTIETATTTGGTKYICLCGQYKIGFYSPRDTFKIVSYAAERVKKEVYSTDECSNYCSGHGYDSSYYLEINENYEYYDNGPDNLTL